MSSVPEGWYVDPSTGTNLRWWSGSTWTEEVAPLPYEPTHSGPVNLFGEVAHATAAAEATPADDPTPADEPIPADDAAPTDDLTPTENATPAEVVAPVEVVAPAEATFDEEPAETSPEPTADKETAAPSDTDDRPVTVLDPEVELTQLTRRELRARRGNEVIPDDTPKHLPPVTSVAAVSVAEWQEPLEELEIPAPLPVEEVVDEPEADPERRTRILRMSVLLGILAVVSSVAVLTAGTL